MRQIPCFKELRACLSALQRVVLEASCCWLQGIHFTKICECLLNYEHLEAQSCIGTCRSPKCLLLSSPDPLLGACWWGPSLLLPDLDWGWESLGRVMNGSLCFCVTCSAKDSEESIEKGGGWFSVSSLWSQFFSKQAAESIASIIYRAVGFPTCALTSN